MKLVRSDFLVTGIFGQLLNADGTRFSYTLEHAYESSEYPGTFSPKIPPGVYNCVRGMHQLEGMYEPFETFEITNVPGHTNILFHAGNSNKDSAGCVLLGFMRSGNDSIFQSRVAFQAFMEKLKYVDSFELTVV